MFQQACLLLIVTGRLTITNLRLIWQSHTSPKVNLCTFYFSTST